MANYHLYSDGKYYKSVPLIKATPIDEISKPLEKTTETGVNYLTFNCHKCHQTTYIHLQGTTPVKYECKYCTPKTMVELLHDNGIEAVVPDNWTYYPYKPLPEAKCHIEPCGWTYDKEMKTMHEKKPNKLQLWNENRKIQNEEIRELKRNRKRKAKEKNERDIKRAEDEKKKKANLAFSKKVFDSGVLEPLAAAIEKLSNRLDLFELQNHVSEKELSQWSQSHTAYRAELRNNINERLNKLEDSKKISSEAIIQLQETVMSLQEENENLKHQIEKPIDKKIDVFEEDLKPCLGCKHKPKKDKTCHKSNYDRWDKCFTTDNPKRTLYEPIEPKVEPCQHRSGLTSIEGIVRCDNCDAIVYGTKAKKKQKWVYKDAGFHLECKYCKKHVEGYCSKSGNICSLYEPRDEYKYLYKQVDIA